MRAACHLDIPKRLPMLRKVFPLARNEAIFRLKCLGLDLPRALTARLLFRNVFHWYIANVQVRPVVYYANLHDERFTTPKLQQTLNSQHPVCCPVRIVSVGGHIINLIHKESCVFFIRGMELDQDVLILLCFTSPKIISKLLQRNQQMHGAH